MTEIFGMGTVDGKMYVTENVLKKLQQPPTEYDIGYRDGESSRDADYLILLDGYEFPEQLDVWEDGVYATIKKTCELLSVKED